MSRQVYVKSFSLIPAGRHYDKSSLDLFAQVLLDAWGKAGWCKIDYVVLTSAFIELIEEQTLASSYLCEYLSLEDVPTVRIELGDASSLAGVIHAMSLMKSGFVNTVAIVAVEKLADLITVKLNRVLSTLCDSYHEAYYGVTPAVHAALMTREYMRRHGYTYEDIAEWSVRMHERGSENPYAYMRRRLTVKDIMQSEVISDPIRLFDIAPPVDGAACVILSTEPNPDYKIEIVEPMTTSYNTALNMRRDIARLYTVEQARKLVEKYRPTLFEVFDKFSIFGILSVEALGLCNVGECPKLLKEGKFAPGDNIVVNASGGLKCLGYTGGASGMYLLTMLVLELLEAEHFSKLGHHETGLVLDIAGSDRASNVLVLKRVS